MTKLRLATTAILFGPLFSSVLPKAASADAACDLYATRAIQQQQENVEFKCGFTGTTWSPDLKAHTAWCASVDPDQWKSELQKRQQLLNACRAK